MRKLLFVMLIFVIAISGCYKRCHKIENPKLRCDCIWVNDKEPMIGCDGTRCHVGMFGFSLKEFMLDEGGKVLIQKYKVKSKYRVILPTPNLNIGLGDYDSTCAYAIKDSLQQMLDCYWRKHKFLNCK